MDDKMKFLTDSILKGKKVMEAVENKTYRTGNIDASKLVVSENLTEAQANQQYFGAPPTQGQAPTYNPENLEKSRMPKEILESFRKNPPQSVQTGIGLSFLDEIAGNITKTPEPPQTRLAETRQPQYQQPQYQQPIIGGGMNELQLEGLKSVLEKLIRETMEKVLSEREQLTENVKTDENIQLKIGESIFSGKITGVRPIKNKK